MFELTLSYHSPSLQEVTKVRAWWQKVPSHRGALLTGLLRQLSYSTQDHVTRGGTTHISCQSRECSRDLPTGQS